MANVECECGITVQLPDRTMAWIELPGGVRFYADATNLSAELWSKIAQAHDAVVGAEVPGPGRAHLSRAEIAEFETVREVG